MNKNPISANEQVFRQPSSRWFAALGNTAPELRGYVCQPVAVNGRPKSLHLVAEVESVLPAFDERAGCGVIFDGALYNRRDLQNELGDQRLASDNDAAFIVAAYQKWGESLLKRLRGSFALVIWDSQREVLLCARDPLGSCPMFYAEGHHELLISTSINSLIRHPNVSAALNRAALAEYLFDRFPGLDETFFAAVKRVPPGRVLKVTKEGRSCYRYWDPASGGTVKWLTPDEVEQFDELLDRAVGRCLSFGPTGIFLSGGLDSVSVAAVAAEYCQLNELPKPCALSLAFPTPDTNEEVIQRSVAAQLGLPQVLKGFNEAAGVDGLIAAGLELGSSLSSPLMNPWLPAFYDLAREGKRRGCEVVLTGGGGDEWLTIGPFLAADMLRGFDFSGIYRLWQSERRSYRRSSAALLLGLLWRFGAKPILHPPAHRFVKQVAPWALRLRHRVSPWPASWVPPKWLAAEASLRIELDQRREEQHKNSEHDSESLYIREMRKALDHPMISFDQEENFEIYRRAGVRLLQPYWDADLVELLFRTPPFLLNHGGRTKGLVRASLARRFPNLGFEQQKKVVATNFYASTVYEGARKVRQRIGRLRALGEMGIVDEQGAETALDQFLAQGEDPKATYHFWNVLNLESWARAHVS
ncbi:MAG TPA: asparagine synthase-related protein [Pyrinomonadaceae bacterium]|nr:asparagine synthase-related protein [Pyrinomonadaceae bacterium]